MYLWKDDVVFRLKGALFGGCYLAMSMVYLLELGGEKIRSVSYNFTICHEDYYPWRDKNLWAPECMEDPTNFSPVVDGVLSTVEWKKFGFDKEQTEEIFSVAPGLVMDLPVPPPAVKPCHF